jgi:hypothetical protein
MVYINYECYNQEVPNGTFGGAVCMCEKCQKERNKKELKDQQEKTCLMNFKIEKNIPIPKKKGNTKGNPNGCITVYPFDEMLYGDSFFVPITGKRKIHIANSLRICAKRKNVKVTVRFVEDGIRVWKIGVITNNKGELKQ